MGKRRRDGRVHSGRPSVTRPIGALGAIELLGGKRRTVFECWLRHLPGLL
jgi:hypothetical protein